MAELLDLKSVRPAVELGREKNIPPMVAFEQSDGGSEAFSYSDFRSVRYDPAGMVKVRFAAAIVAVSGRNLLPVWLALRSHRVRRLRVDNMAEGMARADDEPHITGITITPSSRR
jgi:hypothetical protein